MHQLIKMAVGLLAVLQAASAAASEEKPLVTPKQQVEELMNEGIPFAERMLRQHGEFFPFGVVRNSDGSTQLVGASDGREHPPSQDLIELLNQQFRKGAESGNYAAIAIFFDVLATQPGSSTKTDAVQVGLEHRAGYCVDVFFPYQRSADGTVQWGELFASKREDSVFRCDERAATQRMSFLSREAATEAVLSSSVLAPM
jgi:hypothetical protein